MILPKSAEGTTRRAVYVPAQRTDVVAQVSKPFRNSVNFDQSSYVTSEFNDNVGVLINGPSGLLIGRSRVEAQYGIDRILNGASVMCSKNKVALLFQNRDFPFGAWSSGNKQFVPLLLGLYPLLVDDKETGVDWVIIEEPEAGLHPEMIVAAIVLLLRLVARGYRVVVSVHHPVVLDVLWGIKTIEELGLPEQVAVDYVARMLRLSVDDHGFARQVLGMSLRAYAFGQGPQGSVSTDISSFDVDHNDGVVSEWGGLTRFASETGMIVSEASIIAARG